MKVTRGGCNAGFGALLGQLKSLSSDGFIAIDCEFSGLTSDPDISHSNIQRRYAAIRRLANSRAIFSVGLALFNPVEESMDGKKTYEVAVYDFLMCCDDEFSMNANAGCFLIAHNFSFERMFKRGVLYTRASTETLSKCEKNTTDGKTREHVSCEDATKTNEDTISQKKLRSQKSAAHKLGRDLPFKYAPLPRGLLWRLGRQQVPLILHNGLFDLAFLFAAFQTPLADSLDGFIRQLLATFPAGYYDTKILAKKTDERASFLAYLFAKTVMKDLVLVKNMERLPSEAVVDPVDERVSHGKHNILCPLYSFRGFCPKSTSCSFLHDPFLIVEGENSGTLPIDAKGAFKMFKAHIKDIKRQQAATKKELTGISKKHKKKAAKLDAKERRMQSNISVPVPPQEGLVMEEDKRQNIASNQRSPEDVDQKETENIQDGNEEKMHTAGWDAFCTGYVFAAYRSILSPEPLSKEMNKIPLASKQNPLLLCPSTYASMDI